MTDEPPIRRKRGRPPHGQNTPLLLPPQIGSKKRAPSAFVPLGSSRRSITSQDSSRSRTSPASLPTPTEPSAREASHARPSQAAAPQESTASNKPPRSPAAKVSPQSSTALSARHSAARTTTPASPPPGINEPRRTTAAARVPEDEGGNEEQRGEDGDDGEDADENEAEQGNVDAVNENPDSDLEDEAELDYLSRYSADESDKAPLDADQARPRRAGRPRKAEAPLVPYEEVDRLLVFGEVVQLDNGAATTVFPSYRDLAERFSVAPSIIASYAKSRNCLRRRERAQARIEARTENKLVELRSTALAVAKDDIVALIDAYLSQFKQALVEGRVRADNPADVNTLVRLREFILGGADSRQDVRTTLSLESLQERYTRAMRARNDLTPEQTGVIDTSTSSPRVASPGRAEPPEASGSPDLDVLDLPQASQPELGDQEVQQAMEPPRTTSRG